MTFHHFPHLEHLTHMEHLPLEAGVPDILDVADVENTKITMQGKRCVIKRGHRAWEKKVPTKYNASKMQPLKCNANTAKV